MSKRIGPAKETMAAKKTSIKIKCISGPLAPNTVYTKVVVCNVPNTRQSCGGAVEGSTAWQEGRI
jgi:hypothetical protein